jgi:hypothetical protein
MSAHTRAGDGRAACGRREGRRRRRWRAPGSCARQRPARSAFRRTRRHGVLFQRVKQAAARSRRHARQQHALQRRARGQQRQRARRRARGGRRQRARAAARRRRRGAQILFAAHVRRVLGHRVNFGVHVAALARQQRDGQTRGHEAEARRQGGHRDGSKRQRARGEAPVPRKFSVGDRVGTLFCSNCGKKLAACMCTDTGKERAPFWQSSEHAPRREKFNEVQSANRESRFAPVPRRRRAHVNRANCAELALAPPARVAAWPT